MRRLLATTRDAPSGRSPRPKLLDLLPVAGMVGATALLVAAVVAPATSEFQTGRRALVPERDATADVAAPVRVGDVAIEVRPGIRRTGSPALSSGGAESGPFPFAVVAGIGGERTGVRGGGVRQGRLPPASTLVVASGGAASFVGPPAFAAPASPTVEPVVPAPGVSMLVTATVEPLPSPRASVRAAGAGTRTKAGLRGRAANLVVATVTAASGSADRGAPATPSGSLPAAAAAVVHDVPGAVHRSASGAAGASNASSSTSAR
ncbi:MAG TPA: hypothetical protein VF230_06780 [Acidimicrobiales bacterium]